MTLLTSVWPANPFDFFEFFWYPIADMPTPETEDSDLPRYTRRQIVRALLYLPATAALAPLISGCSSPEPPQTITLVRVIPNDRTENPTVAGEEWSREEIITLAESMRADSQFPLIARAGQILEQNQLGNPSFSLESPLFSDRGIRIFTVADIDHSTVGAVPMAADISQNPPTVVATLIPKSEGQKLEVWSGTSLSIDPIRISKAMDSQPDFLLRLYIAKEIYTIRAFDLAINRVYNSVYALYEVPENELLKNALKARLIHWKIPPEGMPLSVLADLWAHHITLPDYELARERGMLPEDAKSLPFGFDYPSEQFKQTGLLYKDRDGEYRWRNEGTDSFYDQWHRTAIDSWKKSFLRNVFLLQ